MNLKVKSKLTKYLEENQISSVLNDTKWERLFEQLREIEEILDFQRKDLDEPEPDESYWDGDLYHVMGEWQRIEWLNIRALVSESKGTLLQPVVTDRTDSLIQALEKAGTPSIPSIPPIPAIPSIPPIAAIPSLGWGKSWQEFITG